MSRLALVTCCILAWVGAFMLHVDILLWYCNSYRLSSEGCIQDDFYCTRIIQQLQLSSINSFLSTLEQYFRE